MKKAKAPISPEGLRVLAHLFRLLSEPSRLQLLNALMPGEQSVSQLVELTGKNQANVSKQLKTLSGGKILGSRRRGRQVFYHIADPAIVELCHLLCGKMRVRFMPSKPRR